MWAYIERVLVHELPEDLFPENKELSVYFDPRFVKLLDVDFVEGVKLISKIGDKIRHYNPKEHTEFCTYIVLHGIKGNGNVDYNVDPRNIIGIYHEKDGLTVRFLDERDVSEVPKSFYDSIMHKIMIFKKSED